MNEPSPSLNGANGRDPGGRFGKGNPGGRGNPMAKHVNKLRVALLKAVKPKDMKMIIEALLAKARAGDVPAVREILSRTMGEPVAADLLARLESLEKMAQEKRR
jgi:hypothetical protein